MPGRIRKFIVLLPAVLLLAGCAAPGSIRPSEQSAAEQRLSPAQQYAGQVLSYLMLVVLGRAGPADLKAEWSRRGLSAPLDFRRISKIMQEPDQNRSELIVFDTRILGISEVLYHYDPGLNLFKGQNGRQSLFPSAELIALRLLLLQKMSRGEKVRLQGLLDRRMLLFDPDLPATQQDLQQTGLSRVEMRLIRDAFTSDPHLLPYLFSPAMVSELYRIGAVANDPFVARTLAAETLPVPACRFPEEGSRSPVIRIALLPSMMPQFSAVRSEDAPADADFQPDESYRRTTRRLQAQILHAVEQRLSPGRLAPGAVLFSDTPSRPLALHPENADAVLGRFCPDADFTIVLLGRDVIRCFAIGPQTGFSAPVNRLYLDIADIERSWVDPEIEVVARFVAERIAADRSGHRRSLSRQTPGAAEERPTPPPGVTD